MKKVFQSLLLAAIAFTCSIHAKAQDKEFRTYLGTMVNPSGTKGVIDTVKGATPLYLVAKEPRKGSISIVGNVIRVADTTRGTVSLEGSNDGTTWVRAASDTLLIAPIYAAGNVQFKWVVNPSPFATYRVKFAFGATAGRSIVNGTWFWKDFYTITH